MQNRKNTVYDEENTKIETKVIGYAWGIDFSSEKVVIKSVAYSPQYNIWLY